MRTVVATAPQRTSTATVTADRVRPRRRRMKHAAAVTAAARHAASMSVIASQPRGCGCNHQGVIDAFIPSPPSNGVHIGPLFVHAYGLAYIAAVLAAIAI